MSCEKQFTFEDLCKKLEGDVKITLFQGTRYIRVLWKDYYFDIMEDGEIYLCYKNQFISLTEVGTSFNKIDYILTALLR